MYFVNTIAALALAIALPVSLSAQTTVKKAPQQASAKAQAARPVEKDAAAPLLTVSFRKAAKLALRTLDRQSDATVREAGDYKQRKLKCDYYPASCDPQQAFRDSVAWETMERDSAAPNPLDSSEKRPQFAAKFVCGFVRKRDRLFSMGDQLGKPEPGLRELIRECRS